MATPIAFVVMPFDVKSTDRTEDGVPGKIDFDALWERVYKPVLTHLGYSAVRADRDVGALIISEMIQRLAIADLVVADIALSNANVYYEVGVRHAARRKGCVLVAPDWARPVFDLGQIRQLRFPLTDGDVGDAAATAAKAVLTDGLVPLASGDSPVFTAVPGYPDEPEVDRLSAFESAVAELSAFEADVRAVHLAPYEERRQRALRLVQRHGSSAVVRQAVVLRLIRLLRDYVGWQQTLDYIATLPEEVARHPLVLEQRLLALGKTGDVVGAATQLDELIKREGETSERWGLLGGRYKQLYRTAQRPAERKRYLDLAIAAYERGMELDLGNYYPSSNLPRLYRKRNDPRDDQRAQEAEVTAAVACRAAIKQGTADEWARPTLLGNAFDRGDVAEAVRLRRDVESEGPEDWKLQSTLDDLRSTVDHHTDESVRAGLREVLADLEQLLPSPTPAG
jgi:hypothetical protein